MSKDEAVRISDTIAFIRTAAVPPAHNNKRGIVADILAARDADGKIGTTVSPAMSQGSNSKVIGRGDAQQLRHYRRAIILIRMVLQNADRTIAPFETAAITDANLPAALGTVLDEVCTTLDDLTAKLIQLKANPVAFLTNNAINMVRATSDGVLPFGLSYDPLEKRYEFRLASSAVNLPVLPVDVFHVDVQSYDTLAKVVSPLPTGDTAIRVIGHTAHGADIMVTTQLTGCSVVYYLNGGNLVAAHVQPPVGGSGETVCTALRGATTQLTGAPGNAVTNVFGPQAPVGVLTTNYQKAGGYNFCIGVRIGGTWGLYGQRRTAGANGIKTAWKIQ